MKLTEKELNEFPIGTIIYYENYEKYMKLDNSDSPWREIIDGFWISNEPILAAKIQKVEIPTYTEYIPPKPILDDKEKEYLSNVIKPWRNKVYCICKAKLIAHEKSYIQIYLKGECPVGFPCFNTDTMYKGMELDREYSLEELGL